MKDLLGVLFANPRWLIVAVCVFGGLAGNGLAAEGARGPVIAEKPNDGYISLVAEYESALKSYFLAQRLAAEKGLPRVREQVEHPRAIFTVRFLNLAEIQPKANVSFASLAWVVNHADPEKESQHYQRAVELLLREHIASERLVECAEALTLGGGSGPALGLNEDLLRGLIARSPHERVRSVARLALAQGLIYQSSFVATLKAASKDKLRELTEISTPEFIAAMREKDPAMLKREGTQLLEQVVAKCGDWEILVADEAQSIGKIAGQQLHVLKEIREGARAPSLTCIGTDGKPVRLGDLKGKLVVLKIWATWCVSCRRDFPHLRELEKRMTGKPFALVLVSIDDDLETLARQLAEEDVPGMQWHSGPNGEISRWYVEGISRVFVIDSDGIFRGIDVAGERLDQLVEAHLPIP